MNPMNLHEPPSRKRSSTKNHQKEVTKQLTNEPYEPFQQVCRGDGKIGSYAPTAPPGGFILKRFIRFIHSSAARARITSRPGCDDLHHEWSEHPRDYPTTNPQQPPTDD